MKSRLLLTVLLLGLILTLHAQAEDQCQNALAPAWEDWKSYLKKSVVEAQVILGNDGKISNELPESLQILVAEQIKFQKKAKDESRLIAFRRLEAGRQIMNRTFSELVEDEMEEKGPGLSRTMDSLVNLEEPFDVSVSIFSIILEEYVIECVLNGQTGLLSLQVMDMARKPGELSQVPFSLSFVEGPGDDYLVVTLLDFQGDTVTYELKLLSTTRPFVNQYRKIIQDESHFGGFDLGRSSLQVNDGPKVSTSNVGRFGRFIGPYVEQYYKFDTELINLHPRLLYPASVFAQIHYEPPHPGLYAYQFNFVEIFRDLVLLAPDHVH